jgi:antitoxin YefM
MEALTYSETRNNLKTVMDSICDEGRTVIVTRKDKRNIVMMSLEDYNAIQETLHLLSSPRNAERLMKSIREIQAGGGTERELLE